MSFQAYVAFVHPEFTLYGAAPRPDLLLPTVLPNHLRELDKMHERLTNYQEKVMKRLFETTLPETPHENIPKYTFESLEKGIFCAQ